MAELKARHFLAGVPSATVYGLVGAVAAGVAVSLTLVPSAILGVSTITAVATSLFASKFVEGAIDKADKEG
jgi:hypothetical protein